MKVGCRSSRSWAAFRFLPSAVVAAVWFLAPGAASAKDDLTTLKGFERAFRHAHATANTDHFDPLVCWDATTPEMRLNMYEALAKGFQRVIARVEITPFKPTSERLADPYYPNARPTHVFLVWYADDVGQPPLSVRYFVCKKDGEFRLVVCERRNRRLHNLL